MNNILETIERILDGYRSMDARRKRILFVVVALAVIVIYGGNVALSNYNYTVFRDNLSVEEAAEISSALSSSNTSHRVTDGGTTILVKKGSVDQITIDLAMSGIVANGGFTIDDYASKVSLGTTKEDRILYTQAYYQSKLSHQISLIAGIESAEVNIRLGSGSSFLGNKSDSSASVFITRKGNSQLSSNTIRGIQSLVSGYMGTITPDEVSVIDQASGLLTGFSQVSATSGILDSDFQLGFKENYESRLLINLQRQLTNVYGPGKVSLAVNVNIDFSHKTVTTLKYDENGRVLNEQLSQQYNTDPDGNLVEPGTEPEEVEIPDDPQVLLNLVRNWTYGTEESTIVYLPGEIENISISAVYDGSLTDEEIAQLSGIIQAATGYNSERGDFLNVTNRPFPTDPGGEIPVDPVEPSTYYFFTWLTNDLLIGMVAMGGIMMMVLLLLLMRGRKKTAVVPVEGSSDTVEVPDALDALASSTDSEFGSPNPIQTVPDINPFEDFQLSQTQMDRLPGLVDRDIIATLSGAGEVKEIIKQFVSATKKLFDDDIDNAIELVRIMMNDEDDPRRALESTAELLIILGQDYSSVIMKKLTEEEMLKLVQEISHIRSISSSEMIQALSEFANIYDANKYIRKGGIDYAKKLLVSTMGEEYANKLTDKIKRAQNGTIRKPFNAISDVDSNKILNILAGEHPQTISLVLAYLNPMTAARVLSSLPKELQIDVTLRLATMNTASAEVITAIEGMVEDKVANMTQSAYTDVGGIQAIADIINNVERTTQRNLLESLAVTHPKISARIRESLFVFEDIMTLSDADVQIIMRDIEHKVVATSFKGVSEDLQEKIIKNVSKRNREIIESEAELLGPVSVREIEEAQARILFRIQELDDQGMITIEKSREDINDYVY